MGLASVATAAWTALLDIIFPPSCLACGIRGAWLCSACRSSLALLQSDQLRDRHPTSLDGCWSVYEFGGVVREAILGLKYRRRKHLVPVLTDLLHDSWLRASDYEEIPDLLVAVPLFPRRRSDRGYNQAELLADALASRVGVRHNPAALVRLRDTRSQTRLTAAERRANVHGAFSADRKIVEGKKILLIDDVYTTGSTLSACGDALRAAGATSVWAIAVARAP